MSIEQGTNYGNLTPLEKFKVFRGIYDTLTPTEEMKRSGEAADRYFDLLLPPVVEGTDSQDALKVAADFYLNRDENALREAERQKDELEKLVNEQWVNRKYDAEKYLFFEEANKLLRSTAKFHTRGFLDAVYWDILIETYIRRNAGQTLSLSEEAVLNDPLRIGGFFQPSLVKATEQVLYSYEYNSAHAECPVKLMEDLDKKVTQKLAPLFHITHYEGPKHSPAHDEKFCQQEKDIKQEKLNEWRWQFKYKFRDEPLIEVSYKTVSWKED